MYYIAILKTLLLGSARIKIGTTTVCLSNNSRDNIQHIFCKEIGKKKWNVNRSKQQRDVISKVVLKKSQPKPVISLSAKISK